MDIPERVVERALPQIMRRHALLEAGGQPSDEKRHWDVIERSEPA
jgi:hypothetical protein